jgi:hypothetical protein
MTMGHQPVAPAETQGGPAVTPGAGDINLSREGFSFSRLVEQAKAKAGVILTGVMLLGVGGSTTSCLHDDGYAPGMSPEGNATLIVDRNKNMQKGCEDISGLAKGRLGDGSLFTKGTKVNDQADIIGLLKDRIDLMANWNETISGNAEVGQRKVGELGLETLPPIRWALADQNAITGRPSAYYLERIVREADYLKEALVAARQSPTMTEFREERKNALVYQNRLQKMADILGEASRNLLSPTP